MLVRSVEAEQILITGIVAASIAVTFDVIPHPTSGGEGITITTLTEAFNDAVSLQTLGISSTGPVSAVSSSPASGSGPSPPPGSGEEGNDAYSGEIVSKEFALGLVVVLVIVVLVSICACVMVCAVCCRSKPEPAAQGGPPPPPKPTGPASASV